MVYHDVRRTDACRHRPESSLFRMEDRSANFEDNQFHYNVFQIMQAGSISRAIHAQVDTGGRNYTKEQFVTVNGQSIRDLLFGRPICL